MANGLRDLASLGTLRKNYEFGSDKTILLTHNREYWNAVSSVCRRRLSRIMFHGRLLI